MRPVFFALLLINLILLVWGQGYLGGQETGREPERLKQQLEPDKLRILSTRMEDEPVPPASENIGCKRIAGLAAAEAESIRTGIAAVPRWEAHLLPQKESLAHWVVIPELTSRAIAEKKKTELRQLGVNEGQVVEDAVLGPFAVSLGIFRNEQLAEEFLQSVARKGVRSARLAKRALPQEKVALELRAPAAELARRLPELLAPLAHASVADCAGE